MEAGTEPDRAPPRRARRSVTGVVLAVLMLGASLDPSLLARSWVFQGVLSGVGVAVGYALGAGVGALGQRLADRLGWRGPRMGRRGAVVLAVLAGAWTVWVVVAAVDQHRWTWDRLGYSPTLTTTAYAGALLLAVAVAAVLAVLGLLARVVWSWVARLGARWLPASVAAVLAAVVVGWAVLAAADTWVLQRTLDGMNAAFEADDLEVDASAPDPPPADAPRSGTSASAVSWTDLGDQGRRFLSRGPDAAEVDDLAPAGAAPAVDPARVFVGRASAGTVEDRVGLAVAELDRLDAFERRAVLVVVPTGTGWVNEQIVAPVEHLLGGDVATVAVQYSHLPSPLAYLAEHDAASRTGAATIEAVRDRIAALPAADRPMLLVAGESLGSFGGAQAFDDLDDMVADVDRSLWIGAPEFMHLRRQAEADREPGSTQVRPVVGDGEDVVVANRRSDLDGTSPRSVFLQQADDPIVWWDWGTAVRRPDWLAEPLDPAVNPAMTWRPFSTFANLTVDMAVGNDFDEDHGHLYGTQPLAAWTAMLAPPGWEAADVERLREHLARLER